MNILLVTNLFPTPVDPERGIFTFQLVKRLQKLCNVTVVCPLPYFPNNKIFKIFEKYYQFSQVPGKYEIDGIQVYSPKYPLIPKLSESRHAQLMSIGIQKCIKNLNDKFKFDAVNSHWLYPDSCATQLAIESLNIPHIATGLGCDINHDLIDPDKRPQILNMLNKTKYITVVSNDLKNNLISENIDNKKIFTIENGINFDQFNLQNRSECRSELGIDLKIPVILYVGRLSHEKSVTSIISAAAKLRNLNYNFQVYIVGDGPEENNLRNQAESLNISDKINFTGKVNHRDISRWMGASDFFCLPSIREGCPNVILEALGTGRPVVASRVGAIPDLIDETSGILFEPENIDEMVKCFKIALNKKWDENKINNSVKSLSWEHAAEKYYDIYKKSLV